MFKKFTTRLLSQAVGDAFNEGLYEEQARLRAIPLLESRPKYKMRNMTAREACGNQKVSLLVLLNDVSLAKIPWFCGVMNISNINLS